MGLTKTKGTNHLHEMTDDQHRELSEALHRVRLFMVCTRSKAPAQLPLQQQMHIPASAVVDLGVGNWSDVDKPGRSEFWRRKAEEGAKTHGGRPFILRYFTTEKPWRSMDVPMPTVTTIDHNYIVAEGRMPRPDLRRVGGVVVAQGTRCCPMSNWRMEPIRIRAMHGLWKLGACS